MDTVFKGWDKVSAVKGKYQYPQYQYPHFEHSGFFDEIHTKILEAHRGAINKFPGVPLEYDMHVEEEGDKSILKISFWPAGTKGAK